MDDNFNHQSEESSSKESSFNVITLNCWGLLFFSKHRFQRIQSIAQYLREQKYDFVFLQELWVKSDFDLIRQETSSIYKFAHLFPAKSILGTSGLAILSKWSPTHVSFMPFTVNGSPFRPWHGDWFTGKGTAYVQVDLKDIRVHLFCTHMHAQYSENEAINDQYSIHRICQSYQLGKFINMTKDLVSDTGKSSELFILAGDLNTSPDEFPFQLLESITGLHNICHHDQTADEDSSVKHRSDLITCGHSENSYTEPFSNETTKEDKTNRHKHQLKKEKEKGKQIDFVLYKLVNKRGCDRTLECHEISNNEHNFACFAERLQCLTKDPKTGLSFSDHQPVAIKLKIKKHGINGSTRSRENGEVSCYTTSSAPTTTNGSARRNFESEANNYKGSPESEMLKQGGGTSLHKALKLMKSYISDNESSKQKVTYSIALFGITLVLALAMLNIYHSLMDPVLLVLSCMLLSFTLFIIFIAIEFVHRFEQHGIRSIIEEMSCLLTSSSAATTNSHIQ